MTVAFDSIGFIEHLENSGIAPAHAKAHAQAARDFIMPELVNKEYLNTALDVHGARLTLRLGAIVVGTATVTVGALTLVIKVLV